MQLLTKNLEVFKNIVLLLEQDELSYTLGDLLKRLHQYKQGIFGFSFSKLSVYDLS